MSEHQYYEFQALDRPLTQSRMDELRAYSFRARISSRWVLRDCRGDLRQIRGYLSTLPPAVLGAAGYDVAP